MSPDEALWRLSLSKIANEVDEERAKAPEQTLMFGEGNHRYEKKQRRRLYFPVLKLKRVNKKAPVARVFDFADQAADAQSVQYE